MTGMNLIYGYLLGISTWVIIWALKKLTIREGIKEVMKEDNEKEKKLDMAIEKIEEAKLEIKGE